MKFAFGFLLLAMLSMLINSVSFPVSSPFHSTCRLISMNRAFGKSQKIQQSLSFRPQRRSTLLDAARRSFQQSQSGERWSLTNTLIAANVLMFLLTMRQPQILRRLMKINVKIAQGEWYRVLTSCFLHGDWSHILANGLSLSQLGPSVESLLGGPRFLTVYLASGAAANLLSFSLGKAPFALGASGCTFGLLGAYAAFFYKHRKSLGRISESHLESVKRMVIINLIHGLKSARTDNIAHIGGFLVGASLAYLLGTAVEPSANRDRPKGSPSRGDWRR